MAEKKKGFDLAESLKAVSRLDTGADGREKIQYIHVEHIKPDERNFYQLDGIDELAASIELVGLQQPLRVRPDPEHEGEYILVSGHRRHAALKKLTQESQALYERFAEAPCIVERQSGVADEVEGWLQELRLIYGNSDTRKLSSADLSKQTEKVEELLYKLKKAGVEFPGKMRDHVAEACKVSGPKLARLKVIREKLIPDYKAEWEAGRLGETAAYAVARFPAAFQERLYRVLACWPGHTGNSDKMEAVLKKQAEGWDWNPCLTCPDGKACKRGDTFLRRDCGSSAYQGLCGGKTCCLECDLAKRDWSPCEQMCSKAKAARKEKSDAKKAAEEKAQQKIQKRNENITQQNAKRLMKAIEAAGLSDKTIIPWGCYDSFCVKKIREWANGVFEDNERRYGPALEVKRLDEPVKVAKLLGCSTDWLLGLTEELTPTVAAPTAEPAPENPAPQNAGTAPEPEGADHQDPLESPAGPPTESGKWVLLEWLPVTKFPRQGQLAALKFDMDGDSLGYRIAKFDSGCWCYQNGVSISRKPIGWFPLPESNIMMGGTEDDQV